MNIASNGKALRLGKFILSANVAAGVAASGMVFAGPAIGAGAAVTKETPANLSGFNLYRPTAGKRGPKPVIVWANGGCVKMDFTWTTLFERWASEGFVVITINSAAPAAAPAAPVPSAAAPAQAPSIATAGAAARSTAADQGKAIDWAIKETAAAGSPYKGQFDAKRIVAAGNSCGGISSLTLASQDPRVKSVFILSGSSVGPGQKVEAAQPIMSKVSAPVLFVVGGKEDIATAPVAMDYDLLPSGVPAMVVNRSAGDHRTVSTDKGMLRDAAEISVNWFKATLYGDKQAKQTLTKGICPGCDPKIWSAKSKNFG